MGDLTPDMRIGGYAPGNYMCRCIACDQQFIGDKRAVTCFDCAKEQVTTAHTLEQVAAWLEEQERTPPPPSAPASSRPGSRSGRRGVGETVICPTCRGAGGFNSSGDGWTEYDECQDCDETGRVTLDRARYIEARNRAEAEHFNALYEEERRRHPEPRDG